MDKEKIKAIKDALANIEKRFGKGAIMKFGEYTAEDVPAISTTSLSLDKAIGIGGIPKGRITEIYGPECLDASTYVQYTIWDNGKRVQHSGGSIERLYERFNNKVISDGRGKNRPTMLRKALFTAPSLNEEGRIFQNEITNVVYSGEKECYEITTKSGLKIVSTEDHKFLSADNTYKPLKDLKIGDSIFIHNKTPFTVDKHVDSNLFRKYIYVKNHPVAGVKICNGYKYHRLKQSRAVVEAQMNGLEFSVFINRLNSGEFSNLRFLTREQQVHHKNDNVQDDSLDNLEVIDGTTHGKYHAKERHNNLRFKAVTDKIKSIKNVGVRKTYDISMKSPFNNYVANNFVVHNSGGKTTLALHVVSEAQKAGGTVAYIDTEHALDAEYTKKLGVNIDEMLISQPDSGEQALEIAEALIRTNSVDLIVIDSVAALVSRAELDGEMGDSLPGLHARLMSQAMRKLTPIISQSKTAVVFINQIREKIGVMFGSPEVTTGGRALKFYASLRLDIRRIAAIKKDEQIIGHKVKIKIAKNKLSAPFKEVENDLIYGEGLSKEGDLIDLAVEYGVVDKSGAWYSFKGDKVGQGRDNAKQMLKDHPALFDQIKTELLPLMK